MGMKLWGTWLPSMNNQLKLQILNKAAEEEEEDLIFISNYIAKDNPDAAKKY